MKNEYTIIRFAAELFGNKQYGDEPFCFIGTFVL